MAIPARNPLASLLLAAALLPLQVQAADVYLDTNGVTSGSGNTDTTWDAAAAIWGTSDGTGAPAAWTSEDVAILAAGSDYTGTRILTVSGTQVLGGLKLNSANTGLGSLTVTGGTLDFGSSLGSIDFSAWGTSVKTFNLASTLAGSGGLEIRSFGNMSASGGGNGARFNLTGTNTFTGDLTILSGLVSYGSNAAFGDAANRIILNGGGLLDPTSGTGPTLSRDIEVLAGGGTLRAYGSTTMVHAGALVAADGTVINRTDGGTVVHSGDLSGFLGTYNVQRGTTRLSGSQTIRGNWNLGEGTSGTTLAFGRAGAQRFEGAVTESVASTLRVEGSSDLTFAGSVTASTLSMNGTGSILRVVDGADLSFTYLNIGDGSGTSGHIYQTGGTLTIRAGNAAAMRLGHWTNSGNRASLIEVSGGTFDASATATINVGWDGDGDIIVGGGAGAALLKASSIRLDASGNSTAFDNTLTVSALGTVEVADTLNAASSDDRTFLSGGTLRKTGASDATWTTAITATDATTSTIDVGGLNLSLSSGSHLGAGTVNLSSATGSLVFSQSGNHTVPWALAGTTAITKTGNGILTLAGASTHTGTFAVSAGRLTLASGSSLGSALSLASGTTLGGQGAAANVTFQSGSFLNLTPAIAGSLAFGDVAFTGTTLRLETYAAAGTILPVFSHTGTLTGTLGTDLAFEGAANYRAATFADTDGAVTLDLETKNLTWSGTGGGTWDLKTSTRFNADADNFAWGDHVTFSGSSANTTVTLAGELRPGSLTVAGDTNYTLAGSAGNFLAGPMALTKTGGSTLTISGPHTFTGGTTLSQGTVVYTGSNSNGLGTGGIVLGDANTGSNAVSLLLTNGRALNNPITVSSQATGTVTLGYSGTGGSYTAFSGPITLERDLVIQGGTTDRFTLSGAITGTGNITVQGGQRVTFDASNSWVGNLTITGAGTVFQTFNGNSIPNTANVTVDSGAIFRIYSSDTIAGLNGAGNLRPYVAKPTLTLGGNDASGDFSGTWTNDSSDHLNVTKTGAGTQTFSGSITSPGALTVSSGTVVVSGAGEFGRTYRPGTAYPSLGLSGSGALRVATGGNLTLRRNADFTGSVTVAGGTLTLGHANAVNTGSVTLSGGTLAFDNRGAFFTALSTSVLSAGTLATHTTTADFGTLHNTSGDTIPDSTTHAYVGKIYLTAGQWSFAKNFDDAGSVTVDGTQVLSNATWNAVATGSFTAAADGWYDIDVRAYQGGGGVGPVSGWTKGIGIKKGAATSANADYTRFDPAGLAALGSGIVYATDLSLTQAIAVTAASTIDTSAMLGTVGSVDGDGNGAGGDVTLSGVVSGSGTLTKSGAGTLALTAVNTLSGGLVATGGTLAVTNTLRNVASVTATAGATVSLGVTNMFVNGHGAALDASRVLTASDGGTIILTSAMESRIGNITLSGGTLTSNRGLSGWDTVLGNVTTGAATVTVTGSAPSFMNGTGGIHLQGVQNFAVADVTGDADADLTVSLRLDNPGTVGGSAGGINKTGAGTLVLAAANTFRGNVTVAGGTLSLAGAGGIWTGATKSEAASLTLTGGGVLEADRWSWGSNQSLGQLNFNNGYISVNDGTIRNVAAASTSFQNRGITVGAGGLTYDNATAGTVFTIASGGNNNTYAANAPVTLAGDGDGDFQQTLSGSGVSLAKSGAGTWSLSGAASHTGATAVNAGTLRLAAGGSLSASTAVTVTAGATLDLAGASTSVASLAGAGTVALAASRTLTLAGSASTTFSGVISGDGSLSKAAAGTLTLSGAGANTFTGGATLSAGTVAIGKATAFGTGTLTLAGATLQPTSTVAIANNLVFQADTTSSLIGAGAGDLMYTGAATGSGTANLNSASSRSVWLQGDWSGFTGTLNVTVNGGGTNYRLGGTPGETSANAGTNGSDFSQAKFVLAGSGADRALLWNGQTGATVRIGELSGSGGRIDMGYNSRAANWSVGHLNTDSTFSGLIAGSGHALTKAGTGTLTLSGANTFTGDVTVEAGTLKMGNKNALGAFQASRPVTQVVVQSGATLDFNGIVDATYGYTLSGSGVGGAGALVNNGGAIGIGTAQASNLRLAADATIGGTGDWALLASAYGATSLDLNGNTLTKAGSNTVSLVNTSLTAGSIRISSGVLALSSGSGGVANGPVNGAAVALALDDTSGAALQLNGLALSLGSLAGGGGSGGNVALGSGGLTVGALGASSTYDGAITGTGSVTKVGAGTLALGGDNAFSGGLTVNGGRVDVASLDALGTGGVTLGASGALRLSLVILGDTDFSEVYAGGFSGSGLLDLDLTGDNAFSLGTYASFGGSVRLTSGVFDNTGFAGDIVYAGGRLLDPSQFSGTTTITGTVTDVSQLPTGGTLVVDEGAVVDFGETEFTGTIKFRGGSVSGNGFKGVLEVDAPSVSVSGDFGQGRLKVGAGKSVTLTGATTGTLVFDGGSITGGANLSGRLELGAGKSLVLGTDLDALGASATLAVAAGASVDLAGSATAATIAFSGGTLANAQNFAGTLAVEDGATLSTDATVGGTVTLASGTTLAGNGTFTGSVTAGAGAILAPGSSPGVTTYGELNLTGGTILQLEFFAAEETVLIGVDTERGYDTLVADTLNFGTAGEPAGGQITLRLATLTEWSDSADWDGGIALAAAEGSSLILGPGESSKDFIIARFDATDRILSDGLNVTSWFAFDTALFAGTGASGYSVFVNAGDTSTWELNLRVVPEPSTYGLALGALALAGAALRRRRKSDQKIKG